MKRQDSSLSLGGKIKEVLANYLKAQFVLMAATALLAWGVLSLLKVKYALFLAVLTGTLSLVPNFGIIIASAAAFLVATFDKVVFLPNYLPVVEGLVILVIFFILNKLIDIFLAPLLLAKAGQENPLILLFLVVLGTLAFGLPGALLSVPLFLVLKTVWNHFFSKPPSVE